MARRKPSRLVDPEPVRDPYRLRASTVETFSTGCVLLDCVLGSGWAYSRVSNIVGDKSTGKTLLAIEACANFAQANPKSRIKYTELEWAFDEAYAESVGLPINQVDFPNEEGAIETVEDLFEDIEKLLGSRKRILYVVDTLDALSDRAEQSRDIGESTYGTKAKKVSEWFRRQNQKIARSKITLMVVSQVRDKLNVTFGEKRSRSGGKALDFVASHALWLAEKEKLNKTRKGFKRAYGITVVAECKKNKVGEPYRSCEFPLLFGYGVDDVAAGLGFLLQAKRTNALGMSESDAKKLLRKLDRLTFEEYEEERQSVGDAVREVWNEIEDSFRIKRRKYPPSKAKKA